MSITRFSLPIVLLLAVLPARRAAAQCVDDGDVRICDAELADGTSVGVVTGGSFTPDGFRIDIEGDRITYDLGRDVRAGTLRVEVSGISLGALTGDNHLIVGLYSQDEGVDRRVALSSLVLRAYGPAGDGTWHGRMKLKAWDEVSGASAERATPVLGWNGSHTYVFEIRWDEDEIVLSRDGRELLRFASPEGGLVYRYVQMPMVERRSAAFDPVLGATYHHFSLGAWAVDPVAVEDGGAPSTTDGGPMEMPPDAGSSPSSDAGSSTPKDAGAPAMLPDGGSTEPTIDASTTPDAGEPPATMLDSGCAAGGAPAPRFIAALLVLALVLRSRRRSP